MSFLRKTFRYAAFFSLLLWFSVSIVRIIKHGLIVLTEPNRYSEPFNDGADFSYYSRRFFLYPTPVSKP